MKNIFFNWNTFTKSKLILFTFFLFTTQITLASVDPTSFTVSGTNGTCQANASIKVTIPTGDYNSGWRAYIVRGAFSTDLPVPTSGGDVVFSSLTPGTYTVNLKDTFTALPTKTILITTSYISLTANHSFKVPTCTPSSSGFVANGELTVRVPTGGIGPFQFDVSYPTSSTNPAILSQTFTGTTNAYRTHVFMNIPGGITPTITITDLANSIAGCGQSITQNPNLPNNTSANVDYGFRAYNFVRTTSCGNPKLYINLVNVTAERDAIISAPGNATITIAGTPYQLTKISSSRWTYDPVTSGGPQLTNGLAITTKFNWGCSILQRTSNVITGDTFTNHNVNTTINSNCQPEFRWTIFGDQDSYAAGYTDRNIYFLDQNEIFFEKLVGGNWELVIPSTIEPNPTTLGTNPMGVNGAHTLAIPSAGRSFTFKEPGTYRYTAKDDCHTISRTETFVTPTKWNLASVTKENYGVLQGTSGLRVGLGITLKPNLTIKISRADGLTSVPFTASGPLNLAGNYVATFPLTRVVGSPNNGNSYLFTDLPLGNYDVELSDGCDVAGKTVRVTLDNPAQYSPTATPVLGCSGSNKINYNYGNNPFAFGSPSTPSVRLNFDNGSGVPGGAVLQTNSTLSGTFDNLNPGNYVITYGNVGPGAMSAAGIVYPRPFFQKVTIAPYGGIDIETSAVMCDPADTNSGIVNVELVNNTILSNTTISLYTNPPSSSPTLIRGPITLAANETGATFTGVPQGTYFVRVSNECTTIERNITINSGSTSTLPIAKASRSKTCATNNIVKLAITGSSSLYDVTWTDVNDTSTVIGIGTPLEITPTSTKTYQATISLKSSFNCVENPPFTSNVTVEVTDDPDLETPVVSDIDLCLNTSRNFTISNSQSGFTYELTDGNGVSFATPIRSVGNGGVLSMTIPSGIVILAGNSFKIKVSNGSDGCSGFLTDVVAITSRQNNLNLDVVSPENTICSGNSSLFTIKSSELGVLYSVSKNGVSIISKSGTGSDLDFPILASQLSAGRNEFLIATSGAGCQNGNLNEKGIILVDKLPVISASTLNPIPINGCNNVIAPDAYTTIAELEANGVTITDETDDASLEISHTDSAITGNATTKYITRTYTITDSCGRSSTVVQYIIWTITTPTAPTITYGTQPTTFCQGGSVILTSSATSGNQWYKDGAPITNATSSTYTATVAGTYTVVTTNIHTCSSPVSAGVIVVVNPSVSAAPNATTIANNCPLETVDLTTLQLTAATGIEYEWWTGTTTSRGTQIMNTTNYGTSGAVFLWSKSTSDACYSLEGQRVDVVITPCCVANVGIIENTNPTGLVHYAPADINGYEHNNSSTPNKTVYVLVNELDQKIKYVNTVLPQFTGVVAGNYKLHALVFGPTVNPTGIIVGNAINQIPDYCGSTASYAVQVVPGNCISNASFTETIPNAKQYALLDLVTNQFIQVNSSGQFTTNLTGIPYQVVGFNYSGTVSGIIVGGTIAGVSASNLGISAGPIVKGCAAVTMQIEGVLYNDRDKNCREESDNQEGLPRTTIYLKLLNSNRQVIKVTSTDGDALHYFTFNADLIDGTYSIILDDNADLTDNTATYPAFWKGSTQTFTIVSGQIAEQLSNTTNFVPMCLQSSTEKPAPKKTSNLQGNTYHFCFNQTATAINVDAASGAEINWYTSPTGGTLSKVAPIPNTKVAGLVTFYVSQTVNGAESERTEIMVEVHPLPELPSLISGPIVVGSETTQQYSIASSSNLTSYNWTLPSDWIGNSVTEDLNVIVGKQGGTIKVNAISANGCVGPEQQLDVRVVIEDDIEIYNSISPNGDGVNDELIIRNIDFYPNNTLEIYNRWGVLVYQADGYGQKNVLFKGLSDGRTTMNRNEELPEGAYFYTLMYVNSKGIQRQKAGYLYIKQ